MRYFRIRHEYDNEAFEVEAGGIPEDAEFAAGDLYGLIEGLVSAMREHRMDELDEAEVLDLLQRNGRVNGDYGDTGEMNGRYGEDGEDDSDP